MTPIIISSHNKRISASQNDEMWDVLLRGDSIYIEYTCPRFKDAHRVGSIGVVTFSPEVDFVHFVEYQNQTQYLADRDKFIEHFHLGKIDRSMMTMRRRSYQILPHLLLKFEGRRNQLKPDIDGISWLKDYTGPTKWVDTTPPKKKLPPKKVYDRLGREINVGDFANYILYHHTVTGAGSYFGTITKITDSGKVFAKNIKLGSKDRSEDKQVKDPSQITIMTKDLMDQLVLAKLRM